MIKPQLHSTCSHHSHSGDQTAINPTRVGSKCAAHYVVSVASEQAVTVRVRLYHHLEKPSAPFGQAFTAVVKARKEEADCFYEEVSTNISRIHFSQRHTFCSVCVCRR